MESAGLPKRKREQRLGPFVLEDELPNAGAVRVFRAQYEPDGVHPKLPLEPGAPACVRVLRERSARDPAQMTKFSREAELFGLVDHPHVARNISRGVSGGRVWHAVEFVEGVTLASLFAAMRQEGLRLRPELVVSIAADLLSGLAAVHAMQDPHGRQLGLIHRNLIPKNVMLDRTGAAKLMDLGSTLLSLREEPSEAVLVGTTGWLAPEQARRDQLNQTVDVYQVAVLMFELLTGMRAFSVDNAPNDIALRLHRNNERARWPRGLEFPIELRALVDQALAIIPEERPTDAAAFFALVDTLNAESDDSRRRLAVVVRDLMGAQPADQPLHPASPPLR